MKRFQYMALFLVAAPAAAADQSMVDNVLFEASGPPGWRVEIGDDVGLRLGHEFYGGNVAYTERLLPRASVREWQGVRRWRSSNGYWNLVMVATPGPCESRDGSVYAQNVRVTLNWGDPELRNLSGCGGRLISRPDIQ